MDALMLRAGVGHARPPRIALVIGRFDGRRGGAESYTRDLAVWLAAAGCDVHVVTGGVGPSERGLPLTFHVVSRASHDAAFTAAVSDRLVAIAPDVSHDMGNAVGCDVFQSHVGSPEACMRAAATAYPAGIRLVRRITQESRLHRLRGLAARQFGSASAFYIAVSRRVAADLAAWHDVPPERIRVVHNGVDAARFHPDRRHDAGVDVRRRHRIGPDEIVVIAMAHNHRLKGVHVLARAVRRLRRAGLPVRALVCGGPRGGWWPGCPEVVRTGPVADPAAHYAAADIAAQPTFYDACSLATLEALAGGLPVVTTSANGASELITPGLDGLVLDVPGDDRALAAALGRLAGDAGLRATLGAAGRRLAAHHTADDTFRKLVAVYAEVIAARGHVLVTGSGGTGRVAA